jgi:hypothetical protein
VTSAFTDESGDLLLVEGTAFHGDEPFVRTIVHLIRLRDGMVAEFWDNPFDQRAEDRFWSARVPAQRELSAAAGEETGGPQRDREHDPEGVAPAARRGRGGIPAQLMRASGHS